MKTALSIIIIICAACHSTPRTTTPTNDHVAELAARRARMIEWLREYEERGVYPTDGGLPVSVFRDAQGVRCPMAELVYRSGRPELVEAVVRENNQVRLADVHEGPLHDWMLGSGFTSDEIAMVQGAMDIDYSRNFQIEVTGTPYMALGQVRGRLETAVRALRDNTEHALVVAAAELPASGIPSVTIGKLDGVLPQSALTSTVERRPPQALQVTRVGRRN